MLVKGITRALVVIYVFRLVPVMREANLILKQFYNEKNRKIICFCDVHIPGLVWTLWLFKIESICGHDCQNLFECNAYGAIDRAGADLSQRSVILQQFSCFILFYALQSAYCGHL